MSFTDLLHKTDALVHTETVHVRRHNLKLQSRGQHVSDQRKEAEVMESWMTEFVSFILGLAARDRPINGVRPTASAPLLRDADSWTVCMRF